MDNKKTIGVSFLIAWLIVVSFTAQTASAATVITVTTTSNLMAEDGQCSLREATISANTDRVFEIRPGATIILTRVIIRNGNPGSEANGGGIIVSGGTPRSK